MRAALPGGADPGRGDDERDLRLELLRLKGALHDPNTSLNAFPARIESIRAMFHHGTSVGLIHLEVDPSGRVEGVYGWQLLDRILHLTAAELSSLREAAWRRETILCQSGICANRFLVFLPLIRQDSAGRTGQLDEAVRLTQARLEALFAGEEFRGMAPRPGFSLGSVALTEHPVYRLERQIDRAIEEVRASSGREGAQERSRQHAELKRIIREQEIEILFQPILNLETHRVLGYEAFSRGPRNGYFERPSTLFDGAREVGMTGDLDRVCQRAALRQARRLSAGDKLFLNARPSSLMDPGFREGLLADLPADYPLARTDIVLEIADRDAIEDVESLGCEVTDLRSFGFGVSIDDVGRAASGFQSIASVRPDFIKVDNTLVHGLDRNLVQQELVRSLCQMGRAIHAIVIAEGIETREELNAVRRCGADFGQGYLFSRPSRSLPAKGRAGQGGLTARRGTM